MDPTKKPVANPEAVEGQAYQRCNHKPKSKNDKQNNVKNNKDNPLPQKKKYQKKTNNCLRQKTIQTTTNDQPLGPGMSPGALAG
jgi:hypothetical protein